MQEELNFDTSPLRIEVETSDVRLLDRVLNSVETVLRPHALLKRNGILISRVGSGRYVVATSADVPCGLTYQRAL